MRCACTPAPARATCESSPPRHRSTWLGDGSRHAAVPVSTFASRASRPFPHLPICELLRADFYQKPHCKILRVHHAKALGSPHQGTAPLHHNHPLLRRGVGVVVQAARNAPRTICTVVQKMVQMVQPTCKDLRAIFSGFVCTM